MSKTSAFCTEWTYDNRVAALEGNAFIMYVVCKEHLELAIDTFVDEYEDAPDVVDLKDTEFSDWDPPVQCAHCEQAGKYLVV